MHQLRASPPAYFNLARWMQKKHIHGGYKLERYLTQFGLLNQIVECNTGETERVYIPIGARRYDSGRILDYEPELIRFISERIASVAEPATLLDCGADVGVIGALLAPRSPYLQRIIYVEPSVDAYECLNKSAQSLNCETEIVKAAVGIRSGKGSLQRPDYDAVDTARYFDMSSDGDLDILSADEILAKLELQHLVIKIDVEGLEYDVVVGATESIKRCKSYTVVFEVNRNVVARTGIDPVEVLNALKSIRANGELSVLEKPGFVLNEDRQLLPQLKLDPVDVYNLAYSSP